MVDNEKASMIGISAFIAVGIIILLILPQSEQKTYFLNTGTGSDSNFTDTTVCLNVGTGKLIVKSSTDGNCEIKSLLGSSDISVTNDSNTITIDFNGTIAGESTQCINVGTGKIIIKNSTSGNCYVKSLLATNGITITNASNTITIESHCGTTGNGTQNIIIVNSGCLLRSFDSGNGITLTLDGAGNIIITNNKPEQGCTSAGGTSLLKTASTCDFKGLDAGLGITLTSNTNNITISKSAGYRMVASVSQNLQKTNIPTSYTDIYVSAFDDENFGSAWIDCSGSTLMIISYAVAYGGSGTEQFRWVDVNNNSNVLREDNGITANQDPRTIIFSTPSWCITAGGSTIEMQGKGTTGTSDPTIKGYRIWAN
ncbi:MAG TPA: hypothetical protein VIH70_06295 [Actinomycetota bacterium]|jgi:hypothetical protein